MRKITNILFKQSNQTTLKKFKMSNMDETFVKHDLKGVLKFIRLIIGTPPPPQT